MTCLCFGSIQTDSMTKCESLKAIYLCTSIAQEQELEISADEVRNRCNNCLVRVYDNSQKYKKK